MSAAHLSDEGLFTETVTAINRAAASESQGGDDATYNYAMILMAESQRRLVESGHDRNCGSGIYSQAYEQATADYAYRVATPQGCTCGANR